MDIMYDRQMSVTIAEFIGDMLKKEAEKLQQQCGRDPEIRQGHHDGSPSQEQQEGSRSAESSDVSGEESGKGLGGKGRKGPGVRFSDDAFRDRNGRTQ